MVNFWIKLRFVIQRPDPGFFLESNPDPHLKKYIARKCFLRVYIKNHFDKNVIFYLQTYLFDLILRSFSLVHFRKHLPKIKQNNDYQFKMFTFSSYIYSSPGILIKIYIHIIYV